jgi:hypothetical protein
VKLSWTESNRSRYSSGFINLSYGFKGLKFREILLEICMSCLKGIAEGAISEGRMRNMAHAEIK